MRPRHISEFPDELLVRISEWAAFLGGRRALLSMALVSRAINRAATQILYRTIVLRGKRQPRVLLAMLEACETNGTYSPPLLRLVHNFSTYATFPQSGPASVARTGIVTRILDACPHIRHVRTTVDVLRSVRIMRGYQSIFVAMDSYPGDWTTFLVSTGVHFPPLKRLHLDLTVCADNLFRYLPSFARIMFPSLDYVSAQGFVRDSFSFFVDLAEELIALPNFKRFVIWLPSFVEEFPEYYRPGIMALCKLKDDRVCIAQGIDQERELPMWKTFVERRSDPWNYGTPVAQLL